MRNPSCTLAMLLLCTFPARAEPPPNEIPLDEGVVEQLGHGEILRTPPAFKMQEEGIAWSGTLERDGRSFLRIEFSKIRDDSSADYTVVVRNSRAQEVFRYSKQRFARRPILWSGVIAGDTALIEVHAAEPPTGLSFEIARIGVQQEGQQFLSIILPNGLKDVHELDSAGLSLAAGVAKLSFVLGTLTQTCTGFLVADDLLLTNEHCVKSQGICDTTVAIFGYQKRPNGSLEPSYQRDCIEHVDGEFDHDFALLRLEPKPEGGFGASALRLCGRSLTAGESLTVIQHPSGVPKQFVREGCAVATPLTRGRSGVTAETDFSHTCDSKRGSSGAPVVDARGDVVGLHHLGFGVGEFSHVNRAVGMGQLLPLIGLTARCSPASNP